MGTFLCLNVICTLNFILVFVVVCKIEIYSYDTSKQAF